MTSSHLAYLASTHTYMYMYMYISYNSVFPLHLTDKNEKKFAKVAVNEDSQRARSGTSSPSENSSLSEVLLM